jgi:acyl-CoA synthetase (AMP-forming)/AMP-acid ligase II
MSQITAAADVPPRLTDYEAERATFRIEVPERFNAVADIVERWAAEAPADMALVSLDGQGDVVAEQAVADLARESRRAARALLALGIQQGDPVFVMLPRVPAWYSAVLGAIRIGAVPMPGTNQLTSRDIAYRFRSADAVAAITDAAGLEKIDALEDPPASLRHRIAWGGGRQGWEDLDALKDAAGDGETPASPTARHDAMFLYFTSGTVSHGAAAFVLRARAHRNGAVLAGLAPRRSPLDRHGYGLGEGGVGLLVRAVASGPRWYRWRWASRTPTRSSPSWAARPSPRSARRLRCTGCSSRPTWASTSCPTCATVRARASRSTPR